MPPALVDRLPPIVQLPSDASDSGNWSPAAAAASCTAASGRPASTVIVALAASSARTRVIRASDSTISSRGCVRRRAAAQSGVAALRHDRNAESGAGADDRRDLVGRCRASRPRAPRRGSGRASRSRYGSTSASAVSRCASPTMPAKRSSKVAPGSAMGEDSSKPRRRPETAGHEEGNVDGARSEPAQGPGRGRRRVSVFPAGRARLHAEDVESAGHPDPGLRARRDAGRGRARRHAVSEPGRDVRRARSRGNRPQDRRAEDHRELADDERQHDADEHQDDGAAEGVARGDARRAAGRRRRDA